MTAKPTGPMTGDDLEIAGEAAVQTLFAVVRRRFRALEEREHFNQQQLADHMDVPRSQVSRWLKSPSNITVRSAAKLLAAMGYRLELRDCDTQREAHKVAVARHLVEGLSRAPDIRKIYEAVRERYHREADWHFNLELVHTVRGSPDVRLSQAGEIVPAYVPPSVEYRLH